MNDEVNTERLRGERVCERHLPFLCGMHEDPLVMATLGGMQSREQTLEKLHWNLDLWERDGHGLWIFFAHDTDQFVGRGGPRKMSIAGSTEIEVGFALMPQFWGRGLASEIAICSVDAMFSHFSYDSLVSITLATNRRAQQVMKRTGFGYEKEIAHGRAPHVLYRIRRARANSSL